MWVGIIAAAVLLPAVRASEPWDVSFAGDPKAIIEAAKRVGLTSKQGVVILLEDHRYSIDENRRTVSVVRKVFRANNQEAVEDWSSVEQEYEPWHEKKPELRARVIGLDGVIHWLDPKTISESPAREYDSNVFSDRRILRAPLPAVTPGAVVEYEITLREVSPLFEAGVTRKVTIVDSIPIQRFRIRVEASSSVPLRTVARMIPESALRREESGGKIRVECEIGPLPVRKKFEGNLPSDTPSYPFFAFSTGSSWQEVSARYESIVDQQIRLADLTQVLNGIDLTGSRLAVAALAAKLHKEVRYTGLEFGESAIIPQKPAETLKRGYGDCKDKATLLVAMLRAAGLEAHVALLSSGSDTDIETGLPGLGGFDHAIAYVSGDTPIWIDATASEARIGTLPLADQGRLALIADRSSTTLVPTPESLAGDNWSIHTLEIHMSDYGSGEIRETIESAGSFETQMRQTFDSEDQKKVKEALDQYAKNRLLAKSIGEFSVTKKADFSGTFRLSFQALNAGRAATEQDDAVAVIFPYLVFEELPFALIGGFDDGLDKDKKDSREHDFVFSQPHRIEYRYKIFPPALFRPNSLPETANLQLGPATYRASYRTNPDGIIEAIFQFETGKRRLTPAEFVALREGLRSHSKETPQIISFVSEANEQVALGEIGKALKLVQANTKKNPDQGRAHVRLSRMLVTACAGEGAVVAGKKAIELEPTSNSGWQALAWAYQHDSFGRRFRGNWNPIEAERCFREAIKLDPDDVIPRLDLAILLEHDNHGLRYAKGARLAESVALYLDAMKTSPLPMIPQNLWPLSCTPAGIRSQRNI